MGACIVSAMLGGGVRQVLLDGGQITTNFFEPISIVVTFAAIVYLLSIISSNKFFSWLYIVLLIPILYFFVCSSKMVYVQGKHPSIEEIVMYKQIQNNINIQGSTHWGYFRNYDLDENKNSHKTRLKMFFPIDKMPHIVPFYAPYCLSALNIPEETFPWFYEKKESQLYKFVEQQKLQKTYVSDEQTIIDFIYAKQINYIAIESGSVLPDYLKEITTYLTGYNGNEVYFVEKSKIIP